ncbi:MAG: hypothetical protein PWP58_825 [Bacillota bacterium]|nr:hypothetical protein [Bacillota bacterium]
MVDFKYHLLTLIAVFLALAVGVIVGTALPGAELVFGEQQSVIEELKVTFEELRNEVSARQAEIELLRREKLAAEEFGRCVLPLLVADRLTGRKIGLIIASPPTPTLAEVRTLLTLAGAEVVFECTPGEQAVAPPERLDAAVLIGPWEARNAEDLTLLRRILTSRGVRMVGAVGKGGDTSLFKEWSIPAVDNIDSASGQAALVALLAGTDGYYGLSPVASDGYFPSVVVEWGKQKGE